MMEKLTAKEKKAIRELFDEFDKDNNDVLSASEVRKGLFNLGRNPTEKDIKDILDELGIKKGEIRFEEFEKCMAKYFLAHVDPAKELEMAFATFDKDKSGYIDIKELRYVLTHLGEKIPRKDVDKMFKDMDKNKDGKLDYKELAVLLTSKKNSKC